MPILLSARRALATLIVSLLAICLFAQSKDTTIRTHAFTIGIGSSHQLDTYLSPRDYTGYQINLMHETLRMTTMVDKRISYQSLWQGSFTSTHNSLQTARYFGGHVGFDALWHYNWTLASGLRLMAGGAVGADAGFLFSTRGGNNPAQGRLSVDFSASVMANYKLRLGKKDIALRYQANMPLVGMMFSPQFGQSYYDMYQGNINGNVCFSHPVNAFSLWQQLSVDIPLGKYIIMRAGYLCDIRQSHIHSIKVHDYSHSFMIGLVRTFSRLSLRDE